MVRPTWCRQRRFRRRTRTNLESKQKAIFDSELELRCHDFQKKLHPFATLRENKIESFFMCGGNYNVHLQAQNNVRIKYIATLLAFIHRGNTKIPETCLGFSLAAAFARQDKELIMCLLNLPCVGVRAVLKALCVLDIRRRVQAACKLAAKAELATRKISRKKIMKAKAPDDTATWHKLQPKGRSATGAVAKYIRAWTRVLSKDELDKYVNPGGKPATSKQLWKKLADICHFNPEKDFPACPSFLRDCFAEEEKSSAEKYTEENVTSLNVNEKVVEEKMPLKDILRLGLSLCLTEESKCLITMYSELEEVLSNYNCLECSAVDQLIIRKIVAEEEDFVKDELGRPKLGRLISYCYDFLMVQDVQRPGHVRLTLVETEDGQSVMVPVYDDPEENVGARVYEVLLVILLRQMREYRDEICTNYTDQPYIFLSANYSRTRHMKKYIQFYLITAVFAMITGGQVCEPPDEDGTRTPRNPENITSILKMFSDVTSPYELMISKIEELTMIQMVVPYFFVIFGKDYDMYDHFEHNRDERLVAAIENYVKNVNPNLVLVTIPVESHYCSPMHSDLYNLAVARNIKTYEYCILMSDPTFQLDGLVHLLRFQKMKLFSLGDQVKIIQEQITTTGLAPIIGEIAGRHFKLRNLVLPLAQVTKKKPKARTLENSSAKTSTEQSAAETESKSQSPKALEEQMEGLCTTEPGPHTECGDSAGC